MAKVHSQQPAADAPTDTSAVAVSVVAPAYNEADNLRALVPEIVDVLRAGDRGPWEVVLVDDGSADDTEAVVSHAARLYDGVRAVVLSRNFGQSAALAAGIDAARGDVVVTLDADGQNDPADIPALLDRLDDGLDCVSGNRRDRADSLAKTLPSAVQTRLATLTGPGIKDFGCALTAYRAEALEAVHLYGEEHRYIPAQLHDQGYRIDEVDVEHRPRTNGETHYGVGRLLRGFADLVFHALWYRFSTRWFHLFGGLGLIILLGGLGLGGYLVASNWLTTAELLPRLPELLLSVGMVLFGALLLIFGVILQVLTRLYYRDETPYRVLRVVE